MENHKMKTFAGLLASASLVAGHGYVNTGLIGGENYTFYQPYTDPYTSPTPERVSRPIQGNGPVTVVTYDDIQCGGDTADGVDGSQPANLTATVAAGSEVDLYWTLWPTSHVGPTITYMAKCDNDDCTTYMPGNDSVWFKIQEHGRDNTSDVWGATAVMTSGGYISYTVPECIESGAYLVRHEIIALHAAETEGGAQFYPGCHQIKVTGGSGSSTPSDLVAFPGAYNASDPGILYNPYEATTYTVPGPSLFTCSGSSSGSSSSSAAASASVAASTTLSTVTRSASGSATGAAVAVAQTTTTTSAAAQTTTAAAATASSEDDGEDDGCDAEVTVTSTVSSSLPAETSSSSDEGDDGEDDGCDAEGDDGSSSSSDSGSVTTGAESSSSATGSTGSTSSSDSSSASTSSTSSTGSTSGSSSSDEGDDGEDDGCDAEGEDGSSSSESGSTGSDSGSSSAGSTTGSDSGASSSDDGDDGDDEGCEPTPTGNGSTQPTGVSSYAGNADYAGRHVARGPRGMPLLF